MGGLLFAVVGLAPIQKPRLITPYGQSHSLTVYLPRFGCYVLNFSGKQWCLPSIDLRCESSCTT
eukprot:4964517-Amphidinium_carterae.1